MCARLWFYWVSYGDVNSILYMCPLRMENCIVRLKMSHEALFTLDWWKATPGVQEKTLIGTNGNHVTK